MAGEILYKELSYSVVGCFYKIYNTLGPGHKEEIYHKALAIEFNKHNLSCESKKKIKIEYEGKLIGVYQPDFIIEDKILVETKPAVMLTRVFEKQLYYYLKSSGCRVGYLVNFGSDKIDIRRRVN